MSLLETPLEDWPAPPLQHLENLHVLLNPASGSKEAEAYFESTLQPFLGKHEIPYKLHRTVSASAITALASTLPSPAIVITLSGDGTLHELIAGLSSSATTTLIPLPFGTANALYHSLFPSHPLASLAQIYSSQPKHLPLAEVTLNDQKHLAVVVISTALHASILFDSDKLRSTIPGLERFKKAAEQNWGTEYSGLVRMSEAKRYMPGRGFVGAVEEQQEGPWAYLNCCLTDRLEEKFVVAPRRVQSAGSVDVVGIRRKGRESKKFFEEMLKVFGAMYDGGKHVDLVWEGDAMREWKEGDDPEMLVVDYWRCSCLIWQPTGTDERSRLMCIDGTIHNIASDQSCTIQALSASESNIKIWA